MYLRLAMRNARRSIIDYLLYILTMVVLLSIICVSNCIALWGNMQANFQTASLPLLIVLIMVFLISYMNSFMVKQRAKEFATYLLLGMKKEKLSSMFACEISLIGIVCFFIGIVLGLLIYNLCFRYFGMIESDYFSLKIMRKSILDSFVYFCIVELLSMFHMKQTVYKLQISQLMNEKRRNQPLNERGKIFWLCLFAVSISILWLMLCGIVILPDNKSYPILSVIAVPVLCCIFSFYKWLYATLSSVRMKSSEYLYKGNWLYWIAEMTSGAKTSANINAIFSMCLLFSACSFIFGTLLLSKNIHIFPNTEQKWMAFLQISICIIFMVIYFSILSLLQIIDLKRQAQDIRILHYMGKSHSSLKSLVKKQTLTKLLIPTLMCFVILFSAVPAVNFKLNGLLPAALHNMVIKSTVAFIFCFILLYFAYFYITYLISKRYIKTISKL